MTTFVTVKVYLPREPEMVKRARPDESVCAVDVVVLPFGRVQRAGTVAPATGWPRESRTYTLPVMLALSPWTLPLREMLVTFMLLAGAVTFTEISV